MELNYYILTKVTVDDGDAAEFMNDQPENDDLGGDFGTEVAARTADTMEGREWADTYSVRFEAKALPSDPRVWTIAAEGSSSGHTDAGEFVRELFGLPELAEVSVNWRKS